jgi:energy-coupling factor transport system ATP-binding protein
MRSQDIAIVGILLACAAIARLAANILPTPIVSNLAIGFYCLALILTAPRIGEALGIGLVAGIICSMISHSIYPPANLISEPVGVLVCLFVYRLLAKRTAYAAGTATLFATCASGFTFVLVALIMAGPAVSLKYSGFFPFFVAMSPIVLGTALVNSLVIGLLSRPALRFISNSKNASPDFDDESQSGVHHVDRKEELNLDAVPLVLENVRYQYFETEKPALCDISFTAQKGDFILITGPTASGKTTLCNTLAGITHHEYGGDKQGTVKLFERDIQDYNGLAEISKYVCIVFDDPDSQLIFTSVEEEIGSSLTAAGFKPEEIESKTMSLLSDLSLLSLRDRPVSALSGGQKQRVSIAAALAMDRPLLILDEPTGELDGTATKQVISLLKKLADSGCTVIVADHALKAYADVVTEVFVLEKGSIVQRGDKALACELATEPCTYTTTPYIQPSLASATDHTNNIGSMTAPIIAITDLTYLYGSITALDSISLFVEQGEFLAILGDNGSGKTTLIKHLNGLLRPTKGTVVVDGIKTADSTITELVKKSGLLFQNPDTMLFAESVYDEVAFGAVNTGVSDPKETVSQVLEMFGLFGKEQAYPRSLSRGERQRLAIACILAMKTPIIILDEPTTGLDESESEMVMQRLCEYQQSGHTIIMVTHNHQMAYRHAHRVVTMEHGVIADDVVVTLTGVA